MNNWSSRVRLLGEESRAKRDVKKYTSLHKGEIALVSCKGRKHPLFSCVVRLTRFLTVSFLTSCHTLRGLMRLEKN